MKREGQRIFTVAVDVSAGMGAYAVKSAELINE